jgi:hypothetical protein
MNANALMVDPKIIAQDARFMAESEAAEETFSEMEAGEIDTMHERFVKASGGAIPSAEAVAKVKTPAERIKKESTYAETKRLLAELGSIAAVAKAREFTPATILTHIETMVENGELSKAELEAIAEKEPGWTKKAKADIFKAIDELGSEKLKPLFEATKEKYDYMLIRLARALYETNSDIQDEVVF